MPLMHRFKNELARRAMMKLPLKAMIPKTVTGPGAASKTGEFAANLKMTKALVVTDDILFNLGVVDAVIEGLKANGIEVAVYKEVLPDPTTEQVLAGAKVFLEEGCDGIVAVGGGSSIDCAKVIGIYARDPKPIAEFAGVMKVKKGVPPFIAVPTTHGTGSETTYAAVITSPETSQKFLVTDFQLMPKVAVLDPNLVVGLPPSVSSATGMDALTHAIEAYLSSWATDFSRQKSISAIKTIMQGAILRCYHDGKDLEARTAMLQASFDAGVAISQAAVGMVHALSHTVGVRYHTPHGMANAMFLPHVLDFYGDSAEKDLAFLATECGIGGPGDSKRKLAKAFVQRIRDMQKEMKMPTYIKELRSKDIPMIADIALAENNGEKHSMFF